MKDIDSMVWPLILKVQIHKQPTMVHHDHVVHAIHFFPPIKIALKAHIVPRLMNFDEGSINKFNVALKF